MMVALRVCLCYQTWGLSCKVPYLRKCLVQCSGYDMCSSIWCQEVSPLSSFTRVLVLDTLRGPSIRQ
ncbi:hypothetical protein BDF14DRAFT_256115 [Spinellus fusiger]|nr:hypothetical protein BDF14DRAFT_256115 [Spinellus fusiger]